MNEMAEIEAMTKEDIMEDSRYQIIKNALDSHTVAEMHKELQKNFKR